jgi:uncharacterized protein YkwD
MEGAMKILLFISLTFLMSCGNGTGLALLTVMDQDVLNIGGSGSSGSQSPEQIQRGIISEILNAEEEKMFNLVNSHRTSKGLPKYLIHREASFQSQKHTSYMAHTRRGLTHNGFDDRAQKIRDSEQRTISKSGENVAYNSSTEKAHNALLNSSGHRKNIEGTFTHMGVGIERDNNGRLYVTQFFIKIK